MSEWHSATFTTVTESAWTVIHLDPLSFVTSASCLAQAFLAVVQGGLRQLLSNYARLGCGCWGWACWCNCRQRRADSLLTPAALRCRGCGTSVLLHWCWFSQNIRNAFLCLVSSLFLSIDFVNLLVCCCHGCICCMERAGNLFTQQPTTSLPDVDNITSVNLCWLGLKIMN